MKIVDSKGKLFGKINAIDFCVVVVVIALVLGAVYKFGIVNKTSGAGSSAMQPINYEVKIEKAREYSFGNVQEGDVLYDKTSGNPIGKVVKAEKEPATDIVEMPNGTAIEGLVENRINIILTIEAEGTVTEKGHFVNKTYELLVGSKKKFFTKYLECEGSVSEIL